MAEEIEIVVRLKSVRRYPDSDPKEETASILTAFFHQSSHIYSAKAESVVVREAPESESLKYAIYTQLCEEAFKRDEVWDIRYGAWSSPTNNDPAIRICEDYKINKLISLVIRPLTTERVQITCMCLENGVNEEVPVREMTSACQRLLQSHQCQPWPG